MQIRTASASRHAGRSAIFEALGPRFKRLLKAAQGDAQLADVIRMAMYRGARREELCSLKVEHVKGSDSRL